LFIGFTWLYHSRLMAKLEANDDDGAWAALDVAKVFGCRW